LHRVFLFVVLISISACSSKDADKELAHFPIFEAIDFKAVPGEKLEYEVSAGPFDLGNISVHVSDSIHSVVNPEQKEKVIRCFKIDAKASSKSGISWISKVKHDWSSWVDTSSGRTVKMTRDVIENGYHAKQESRFLPDSQYIVQQDLHKQGEPSKIFKCRPDLMRDLINVIWQLRYSPIEENKAGDTLKYLAFFDSQWLFFNVVFSGTKEVKSKKSLKRYFVLYPIGIESKYLKGKNPVEIWIEADSKRRPFRVQVSSYFGQLAVRLKK